MHSAKSLRTLFNTLIVTLPSLGNIGSLLFLLYFIYAAMGMQLFSHVKYSGELNEHANFRSFGRAMITLVRCATVVLSSAAAHVRAWWHSVCRCAALLAKAGT